MSEIFKSASKIVFIMMALASIILTFIGKLSGDNFMFLAGMAFSFYFANKGETNTVTGVPYAGK